MSDKFSTYVSSRSLDLNGERILGILDYGGWRAVATEATTIEGKFNLWFCVVDVACEPIFAGTWVHGKALVKYAQDYAHKKFPAMHPILDTLSVLVSRTATCVVPKCFNNEHWSYDVKCQKCPYKEECCVNGGMLKVKVSPDVETITESDEEFHQRLQVKLAAKRWE